MVDIALASGRRVAIAKQSALGTIAPTNASAKTVRRTSTSIKHTTGSFESQEKRTDFQVADDGDGQNAVGGDIVGELHPGTWQDQFAALLRRDFTAVTTVSASSGDGFTIATNVLTRAAGAAQSFITDGIKAGMIVRLGAFASANNNSRNCLVGAVTATTMTLVPVDGVALTDVGSADEDATITIPGKRTFIPTTGHTKDVFTVEDYFADIDKSNVFWDCRVGRLAMDIKPNGFVGLTWGFTGTGANQDVEAGSAPYFTSVAAALTTNGFKSVRGYLRLNGSTIAIATGMQITIDLGLVAPEVVFASVSPDVFYGRAAMVSGQMTVFMTDFSLRTLFKNATEVDMDLVFEAAGSAPKDFFSIHLPRVKIKSQSPDDPDAGIQQTVDIKALIRAAATGQEQTTIMVQDSLAA